MGRVIQTTGEYLWLADETQLDAVTALSGSGPAYVFYFIEAMEQAGLKQQFMRAMAAARQRATELGDEFGAG